MVPKIASGAYAVHFLKMDTFFLLEGIVLSPKCTYSHCQEYLYTLAFHSFPHDLARPHTSYQSAKPNCHAFFV